MAGEVGAGRYDEADDKPIGQLDKAELLELDRVELNPRPFFIS